MCAGTGRRREYSTGACTSTSTGAHMSASMGAQEREQEQEREHERKRERGRMWAQEHGRWYGRWHGRRSTSASVARRCLLLQALGPHSSLPLARDLRERELAELAWPEHAEAGTSLRRSRWCTKRARLHKPAGALPSHSPACPLRRNAAASISWRIRVSDC